MRMLLALINANEVFWAETAKIIKFPPKISNNLAPKFVVKHDLFKIFFVSLYQQFMIES